jgi:epoxyqueuosine reductase
VRNAAVAAGNWGDAAAVPSLIERLRHDVPLVRGHAAWALRRIGGPDARAALAEALATESDSYVRREVAGN